MNELIKKVEELQNRITELENRKPDYDVQEFIKDRLIEKTSSAGSAGSTVYNLTGEVQQITVTSMASANGVLVIVWKGRRFKIPYYN